MVCLEQLDASWADEASALAAKHPERCAFIAGWIHEGGLSRSARVPVGWLLGEIGEDGRLCGLIYVSASGIVLPAMVSARAIPDLTRFCRSSPSLVRVVVGERAVVEPIWTALEALGLDARMVREQLAYRVSREDFRPVSEPLDLRVAERGDLDEVVSASAAMAREESKDDPQGRNPELFRERIRERIGRGRDLIGRDPPGVIAFKCNVAALSPLAGQIEGVYTLPAHRRRGLGTRGMSSVTRWVLDRARQAVLLVNEDNAEARRLYAKLGYSVAYESRTVFVET